jgi:hypothetical protein
MVGTTPVHIIHVITGFRTQSNEIGFGAEKQHQNGLQILGVWSHFPMMTASITESYRGNIMYFSIKWSRDHVLTCSYMRPRLLVLDRLNVIIDRLNVISSSSMHPCLSGVS